MLTALLNALGQFVHPIQKGDDIFRIIRQSPCAFRMWDLLAAVENCLGLCVAQSLGAFDDGVGEFGADGSGIIIQCNERTLAKPRYAFLKRADSVAENLREHRDDKSRK